MPDLSAVIATLAVFSMSVAIGTDTEATAATRNAGVSFRVEPYSRTCSFGEEVESICIPTAASGIYWLKNSTDGRVTNDAGISRLSFPCQNIYLQCCYTLRGQNFCGKMTTIVMREFTAQPEDVTCFSSDLHYAYFHCIPSNTSFLSIDWYINGNVKEKTSSSRHDQMKMKLTCSLLFSNTSIQCAVRYSKTCLYSRNASLYVEDTGLANDLQQSGNLQQSGCGESTTTPQHQSYIASVVVAVLGTSFVQSIITIVIILIVGKVLYRKWKTYKAEFSSNNSNEN